MNSAISCAASSLLRTTSVPVNGYTGMPRRSELVEERQREDGLSRAAGQAPELAANDVGRIVGEFAVAIEFNGHSYSASTSLRTSLKKSSAPLTKASQYSSLSLAMLIRRSGSSGKRRFATCSSLSSDDISSDSGKTAHSSAKNGSSERRAVLRCNKSRRLRYSALFSAHSRPSLFPRSLSR